MGSSILGLGYESLCKQNPAIRKEDVPPGYKKSDFYVCQSGQNDTVRSLNVLTDEVLPVDSDGDGVADTQKEESGKPRRRACFSPFPRSAFSFPLPSYFFNLTSYFLPPGTAGVCGCTSPQHGASGSGYSFR